MGRAVCDGFSEQGCRRHCLPHSRRPTSKRARMMIREYMRNITAAKRIVIGVLLFLFARANAQAQGPNDIPPERATARAWFRDAKLGMFVHWGVYSLLGEGEWVMQNRGIGVDKCEWLAATFNPVRF